jgi:putative PIN family toxin of toxin-antitoxin system
MNKRIVLDTNIFIGAVLSPDGAAREVIRLALMREVVPIFGNALFSEYEDVLSRSDLFATARISQCERQSLFEALLHVSEWTQIHFLWRPNLRDESDNHVIELGVASGAQAIITNNLRDFSSGELAFPKLMITTASDWLNWRRQK